MIRVFIWDNHELTGHAAIATDRHYRSFHSEEKHWNLAAGIDYDCWWADQIEQDANLRDKIVDYIDIHGLHEDDVNHYIEDTQNGLERHYDHYNLYFSNCSTVVAHLLLLGYYGHLHNHGSIQDIMWKIRSGHLLFSHEIQPQNKRIYENSFDKLEEYILVLLRNKKLNKFWFVEATIEILRRGIIWTPGDVSRMAHTFKKHINQHGA